MTEQEKLIKACTGIIVDVIADVLYADLHSWSKRPCKTCRIITSIIGKPFGCIRYRKERE